MTRSSRLVWCWLVAGLVAPAAGEEPRTGNALDGRVLTWPISEKTSGRLEIDTRPGRPLIKSLAILPRDGASGPVKPLLEDVDPIAFLTVGTRVGTEVRPPSMSVFNTFFDTPAKRPHQTYRSRLDPGRVDVKAQNGRQTVVIDGLTAGPFAGRLEITVYPGADLVHLEAVLSTNEDRRAYLYDMGLAAHDAPSWKSMNWLDTEGRVQSATAKASSADRALAVRHRLLVAEGEHGTVACFPPPHQFFFARDRTDNLEYVWFGKGHRGLEERFGFGIRQSETGGGAWVPWISAPPGTEQRLGIFLLISSGNADDARAAALRYTHGDRFPDLPGHVTYTSHWHMAIAIAAMKQIQSGTGRTTPDLVKMFKDMNVNIVHLGEFHGDGHPRDPGPLRLAELDALFAECRRLSDERLVLLPGEEANVYLGLRERGKDPGHWMLLFPRPVYWTMVRGEGQPFAERDARYGTVYHVGSRDDMTALLERERGLAWTAHPRIKASSWTPDGYKDEAFYAADSWLGAAWKGMPADLSQPKLGTRVLDLMDDMANWGPHKYVPGEVDVFQVDHTHELYGHMNINYVRLNHVPRFDDGWQPLLDALRHGRFFVTTGEVLLRDFTVGGKSSWQTVSLDANARPELELDVEWTFPLRFAEVVSGDGKTVYRERIDLADTPPFGRRTLKLAPRLDGRKWVRAEVWDVAANGAFTQPVWVETN